MGSVMGIVCEELYGECQPFMVVEDVVVDRDHRRQGVGRALMMDLERRATERGCSYIIFVTEEDRTGAPASPQADLPQYLRGELREVCRRPSRGKARLAASLGGHAQLGYT